MKLTPVSPVPPPPLSPSEDLAKEFTRTDGERAAAATNAIVIGHAIFEMSILGEQMLLYFPLPLLG